MRGLLVLGAGGHGRVVADVAEEQGRWGRIAFLDDRHPKLESVFEWPVLGKVSDAGRFKDEYGDAIVAVGDGRLRLSMLGMLRGLGFNVPTLRHVSAVVSRHAEIGAGSMLFAQSVVNAGTTVGEGCIVNTGATVDHDCQLGSCVHVSPGAHLGGGVHVGKCSWIGIGASVRELIVIGDNVMVGAGAAVVSDIRDEVTVLGVPARIRSE